MKAVQGDDQADLKPAGSVRLAQIGTAKVSTKDKLEEIAAAVRARWHTPAEPSETAPATAESATAEALPTCPPASPLAALDLDTAIRLRWALRDIKAKRTKLTPVSADDLSTLIELGLVELRGDGPALSHEGHRLLDL
jgi:hypothetical protein